MSPQQTEMVRLSILRYASGAGVWGLTAGLLLAYLKAEGQRGLDEETVRSELQYLADKGLMSREAKKISPELSPWRVTAEGRDYLAQLDA